MERLEDLQKEIIEVLCEEDPVMATFMGIHEYDDKLPFYDNENILEIKNLKEDHIRELQKIDKMNLTLEQQDDLEILLSYLKSDLYIKETIKEIYRKPSIYPEVALYGVYILLLRETVPFKQRMKSMVERLNTIPKMLDQGIKNLQIGTNIPKIWVEIALEMTQNGLLFLEQIVPQLAGLTPILFKQLLKANTLAINAFKNYADFLIEELLIKSNGNFAIGEEVYNQILKQKYLLPYKAKDLLNFAVKSSIETEKLLVETAKKINPNKSWKEIIDESKNDYPNPKNLIEFYQRSLDIAKKFIIEKDLFTVPDGDKLSVVETPIFERSTVPYSAYISPAPFEEKQQAFFWITPVNFHLPISKQKEQLQGHNFHTATLITIHSGYPGHHLQCIIANKSKSTIRKFLYDNVFSEGWALYCEELLYEQGFYKDPITRLFQLKDQLWREYRVIIDVQFQVGNMTPEEAVKLLIDKVKLEPVNALAEVKNYIQDPTGPMAYSVGKREILKLREHLKNSQGKKFNLKKFHDNLLNQGAIPFSILEKRLELLR